VQAIKVQAPENTQCSFVAMHHQTFAVTEDGLFNDIHPFTMLTTFYNSFAAARSDPDTMTFEQALKEPNCENFIEAMSHWEIIPISEVL